MCLVFDGAPTEVLAASIEKYGLLFQKKWEIYRLSRIFTTTKVVRRGHLFLPE